NIHDWMFFWVFSHIFFTLVDALAAITEPGARLVYNACLNTQINDFTLARDPGTVHDVEFCLLERRRDFVFYNLDTGFVANDFITFFHLTYATDIETHRGITVQSG